MDLDGASKNKQKRKVFNTNHLEFPLKKRRKIMKYKPRIYPQEYFPRYQNLKIRDRT